MNSYLLGLGLLLGMGTASAGCGSDPASSLPKTTETDTGQTDAPTSPPLDAEDDDGYMPPRSPLLTDDLRRAAEQCRQGDCNTDSTAAQVDGVLEQTMLAVYAFKNRLPEWNDYVRRSDEAWRRFRDEECQLSTYEAFEGEPSSQDDEMFTSCQMFEAVKRVDELAYYSLNTPTYLHNN